MLIKTCYPWRPNGQNVSGMEQDLLGVVGHDAPAQELKPRSAELPIIGQLLTMEPFPVHSLVELRGDDGGGLVVQEASQYESRDPLQTVGHVLQVQDSILPVAKFDKLRETPG